MNQITVIYETACSQVLLFLFSNLRNVSEIDKQEPHLLLIELTRVAIRSVKPVDRLILTVTVHKYRFYFTSFVNTRNYVTSYVASANRLN